MKRLILLLLLQSVLLQAQPTRPSAKKPPLARYFGLHFDFRASRTNNKIGETLTAAMLDSMLTRVKPDFVQVDCKGHPGISSYPTKVGNQAAGYVQDPLKVWRAVTAKHNVALYVHYSGVIDQEALIKHPEWAALDVNGKPDARGATSLHGPYVDQLMIPQLKEVSQAYGVDGAWVDGDCWAVIPDYSRASIANFTKATGITNVPRSPSDPNYAAFLEFNRQSYKNYLAHYVDALHAFNPAFKLTGNWAFSSHIPEPVSANVDFLSGDLRPFNSVNSAAFEARALAPQGKPWDLMGWSFSRDFTRPGTGIKSLFQPCQEAAEVLAMGGGFQSYFKQNADASIQPWTIGLMRRLADFCRMRRAVCYGATPVKQIGIVFSGGAYKRAMNAVYRPWAGELDPMEGILTALLDGQHAVEIQMEHHLKGHMREYPLLIVPEWGYLPEELRKDLLQYAADGGNLLVMGARTVRLFDRELGVVLEGDTATRRLWLGHNKQITGLHSLAQSVQLSSRAKPFGSTYTTQDLRFPDKPAASITPYGKGKIAAVYLNLGNSYVNTKSTVTRDFLSGLVNELFTNPLLTVTGSHRVHVAVNRIEDKLAVNLINVGGDHANKQVFSYDDVPALGPLAVSVKAPKKPARVTLQPEGKVLPFSYANQTISVTVPRLDIHSVILVEP